MAKFSGTNRNPLARQPHRADPHARRAHVHARGRCRVRARRRVGALPARGDEHGRRGHVLRARRGARRALRRARPRGDGDEPGVHRRRRRRRGQGRSRPVPARDDADAIGRRCHGRGVRRRGRGRWPRAWSRASSGGPTSRPRCSATGSPTTAATCRCRSSAVSPTRSRRLYTERAALRYDGLGRQIRMADVIELTHPVAARSGAVGAVRVPARPPSPRRRGGRPGGAADARGGGRARRGAGR